MKRMKLTTAGRVVIFVIVLALLAGIGGFGYNYYKNNIADDKPISSGTQSGSTSQKPTTKPSAGKTDTSDPVINLSLDEWVGWKPIIDANQGLTTQPGSIFDQLGIKVNINIINDATASSNALITGELNAAGYTTNRTAFLSGKFQEAGLDVVMPVFTNYSAGGDGIIAKSGINTVNDLLGKKIGVPRFSEAQTLVAWFVNKSDLSDADKQSIIDNMILFDDASETGEAFFAGQLDVAATWQPYLSYATENSDAHIMFSTTASKSLIMDGIVFRSDFAQAHPDVVTAFIDGIFQANAMYTTEFDYIRSVMPMFAGVSDEEIKAQCGDAEMMGYAENKEVLDSTAPSVYFDMCDIWESLGETVNRKVAMTLFDNQYLLPLASKYSSTSTSTSKPVELTEEQKQEIVNYEALLTKSMTVEFVADTAQFKNPEEAYAIMDEFVSIANTLDGAIIQVEGNINARNYSDSGQALSAERAKAVAKYFIACGIDPNRLINRSYGNYTLVESPDGNMKYPASIWRFPKPHPSVALHATEKPVDLLRYAIRTYTDRNAIVLDNCCGTGSTLIAAKLEGRRYIGIDNGVCDKKKSPYYGMPWAQVAQIRLEAIDHEPADEPERHRPLGEGTTEGVCTPSGVSA